MTEQGDSDEEDQAPDAGGESTSNGADASENASNGADVSADASNGASASEASGGVDGAASEGAPAGADEAGAGIGASILGGAKSIGGALVANKLRIALLVFVGLPLLVVVGIGVGFAVGIFGVPEAGGVQNDFGNVTADETIIESNVTVSNPNPVGVSLGGVTIDYGVEMNDVAVANGTKKGVSIGSGNSTLRLETTLFNDRIPPWFASHARNDERTVTTIDATINAYGFSRSISQQREIETDILGSFASQEDRPVDANLPLIADPVLVVEETDANWGTVSREETPIEMSFTMYNPNTEPYAISELRYNVTMNDVLVSQGATEDPFVIPGRSRNTLHATTAIQNDRLDEWWVSHLDESVYGHQVSRFRIDFTAVVELPNGETTTVPLDDLTYGEWITTDLFDEGGSVGVAPDEDPGGDGGLVGGGSDDGDDSGGTDSGGTDPGGNDTSDGGDGSDGGVIDGGSDDDGGVLG